MLGSLVGTELRHSICHVLPHVKSPSVKTSPSQAGSTALQSRKCGASPIWPVPNVFQRRHALSSRNSKKVKESVGTKLKKWSDKGLLKSAADLERPELVPTSLLASTAPIESDQAISPVETSPVPEAPLSPHEVQLKEYLELCKAISEGRDPILPTEGSVARPKRKPSKSKKKSTESPDPLGLDAESATDNQIEVVEVATTAPTTSAAPSSTIAPDGSVKPRRKRRTADKTDPQPRLEAADEKPATLDISSPAPPALPERWQHVFETDLSPYLQRMSSLVAEFDQELQSIPGRDNFAPLTFLQLRFWQSRFEWDQLVEDATRKFLTSANIAKQALDPAFSPPKQKFDSSTPIVFKRLQREAINITLARKNLLLALPTGGGKTMCYALPSLLEKGITVVVSPLIALIQDQVTLLESMGIGAVGLSSQMSTEQIDAIYTQLLTGAPFKLIYVTPERIGRNERFVNILAELNRKKLLQRVVVDEAHCISEWGHDFRKDYRRLDVLKESMPNVPIMAVTGTCTPAVRKDIVEQLKMDNHVVLQTSFNRPNLFFQIAQKSSETPMADMLYYILNQGLARECGIVYAMTTNDAERLSEFFSEQGILTTFYHGGMTPQARQKAHADWAFGHVKLMCTTVAFGLGIDKSNVRYVMHSTMPTSLESYYQQAGRAGRDGQPADCVLFYQPKDRTKIEHVIKLAAHQSRVLETKKTLAEKRSETIQADQATATLGKGRRKRKQENAKTGLTSPTRDDDPNVNIVDIIDVDESEQGLVRLLQEDGSEILFDGNHPDYGPFPDDPLDAFVRQMKIEKLDDVSSYCKEKKTCRRVHLMRFFGQNFVSQQCEHTCDVCAPSLKRVSDRLTKRGQEEWALLKEQRDKMRAENKTPLNPAIKKLHAVIHAQEVESARLAQEAERRASEQAYERQFERGARKARQREEALLAQKMRAEAKIPALPSLVGDSSPLARKLRRRKKVTVLGDPLEYEAFTEKMEEMTQKRSRRKSEPARTLSAPSPLVSQFARSIQDKHVDDDSGIPSLSTSKPVEPLDTQGDEQMRGLLESIAKVNKNKELRRTSGKKSRGMSSFTAKGRIVREEDEDGYIRTRTVSGELASESSGDPEELLTSSMPPPLPIAAEPSTSSDPATLSVSSALEQADEKEEGQFGGTAIPPSSAVNKYFFEVRRACRAIAQARGILLTNVMSLKTMKEIAQVQPKTVLQLAAIKGIGPGRAQRYASHLLPIFSEQL